MAGGAGACEARDPFSAWRAPRRPGTREISRLAGGGADLFRGEGSRVGQLDALFAQAGVDEFDAQLVQLPGLQGLRRELDGVRRTQLLPNLFEGLREVPLVLREGRPAAR